MSSSGDEAVQLAAMCGLFLDPWQQLVLRHSLGERADGKWSAFQVGLVVGRQNGKNAVLEARELAELFLVSRIAGPRHVTHSAHLFKTSLVQYKRLKARIRSSPELLAMVKHRGSRLTGFRDSHGEESIELEDGSILEFVSRTGSGGQARGTTADLVVWDEAMNLPDAVVGDVMPTVSARTGPEFLPGPQVWYTGSAVNQQTMPYGLQLARIREAGILGVNQSLAYFEWSVDPAEFAAHPELINDPDALGQANPGGGTRISWEHICNERDGAMPPTEFMVERMGIGDWPDTSENAGRIIPVADWLACVDPGSGRDPDAKPVFVIDATPTRDWASIAVAAERADELIHVEVVAHDHGTAWVVDRAAELYRRHEARFVMDPRGPAASLIPELVDAGVVVEEVSTQDYARACGAFYDAVVEHRLRHDGRQPPLDAALAVADARPLGDAWAWKRRGSSTPICPLVAVTLAHWAAQEDLAPQVWSIAEAVARIRGGANEIDEPLVV